MVNVGVDRSEEGQTQRRVGAIGREDHRIPDCRVGGVVGPAGAQRDRRRVARVGRRVHQDLHTAAGDAAGDVVRDKAAAGGVDGAADGGAVGHLEVPPLKAQRAALGQGELVDLVGARDRVGHVEGYRGAGADLDDVRVRVVDRDPVDVPVVGVAVAETVAVAVPDRSDLAWGRRGRRQDGAQDPRAAQLQRRCEFHDLRPPSSSAIGKGSPSAASARATNLRQQEASVRAANTLFQTGYRARRHENWRHKHSYFIIRQANWNWP